jgi:hypothetical protein
MCKELLVILVNKVVDPKRIIGKMEGRGGGEAKNYISHDRGLTMGVHM